MAASLGRLLNSKEQKMVSKIVVTCRMFTNSIKMEATMVKWEEASLISPVRTLDDVPVL